MRFSIKSLMYYTAVAAAYVFLLRQADHGTSGRVFIGFAVLVGLVGWKLYTQYKADMAMMSEDSEQETPGD